MKFSEIPYERPDVEKNRTVAANAAEKIRSAATPEEAKTAFLDFLAEEDRVQTMMTVAYIRHTINTKDPFYEAEQTFADEQSPAIEEAMQNVMRALLASPHRADLEKEFGKLLFDGLEMSVRSFSPAIMELMSEENRLASEYQKLYGGAIAVFDGKELPLPLLGPYKLSPDREVRHRAFLAEAEFFEKHREEFDTLYDKLVKNRNAQARALGHKNYLELGYDRLGRNCYRYKELEAYREQIKRDVVPVADAVHEAQRRRIGVDEIMLWDNSLMFADGNAKPEGTPDEILAAGRKMYTEMSKETAGFADVLFGDELFDVLSRPGKAPGGYCTELPTYRVPFIFSNFNGTAGDVDVLTHEAGHAFAGYRSFVNNIPPFYRSPSIDACEVHSMSMEFLTEPWHHLFFGKQTEKYELGHAADALTFLPYGCMVDDFQHRMYENENLTPGERNKIWLELEKEYRPHLHFGDLPFYGRGGGWQRQLHIYLHPLYYIDYCMAQSVAFGFWCEAMKDHDAAFKKYLSFVDLAGTKTFGELVKSAGLLVPYEAGSMKKIAGTIGAWLAEAEKNFQ